MNFFALLLCVFLLSYCLPLSSSQRLSSPFSSFSFFPHSSRYSRSSLDSSYSPTISSYSSISPSSISSSLFSTFDSTVVALNCKDGIVFASDYDAQYNNANFNEKNKKINEIGSKNLFSCVNYYAKKETRRSRRSRGEENPVPLSFFNNFTIKFSSFLYQNLLEKKIKNEIMKRKGFFSSHFLDFLLKVLEKFYDTQKIHDNYHTLFYFLVNNYDYKSEKFSLFFLFFSSITSSPQYFQVPFYVLSSNSDHLSSLLMKTMLQMKDGQDAKRDFISPDSDSDSDSDSGSGSGSGSSSFDSVSFKADRIVLPITTDQGVELVRKLFKEKYNDDLNPSKNSIEIFKITAQEKTHWVESISKSASPLSTSGSSITRLPSKLYNKKTNLEETNKKILQIWDSRTLSDSRVDFQVI